MYVNIYEDVRRRLYFNPEHGPDLTMIILFFLATFRVLESSIFFQIFFLLLNRFFDKKNVAFFLIKLR